MNNGTMGLDPGPKKSFVDKILDKIFPILLVGFLIGLLIFLYSAGVRPRGFVTKAYNQGARIVETACEKVVGTICGQ